MGRHLLCSGPRKNPQCISANTPPVFPSLRRAPSSEAGGGEVQSLCLPRPLKYHIIPITETSILSRIHATAHTPDTVVKGLTNAEHVASAEAHPPREGRILHMCRR